jgi:hypothetical protein
VIFQVRLAGVASTFPLLIARTRNLWLPLLSPLYAFGDVQALYD